MNRVRELDGLRALACVGVFASHVGGPFVGGTLGVDVFLALSAYLLASRLLTERDRTGRVAVARFYERRVRRIWPLFFVVLGAAWWLAPGERRMMAPTAFFAANFALAWTGQIPTLVGPMWSTCLEEQFYALVPWVVRSRTGLRRAALGLLLAAWAARAGAFYGLHNDWCWNWYVFRWDGFAYGLLLATYPRPRWSGAARWSALVGAVGAALLVGPHVLSPVLWAQPLVGLAAAVIVVAGLAGADPVLGNRPAAWIGERTYGIYLFHLPLLHWLPWPAAALATVGLAAVSYRFLERPVLDAAFQWIPGKIRNRAGPTAPELT